MVADEEEGGQAIAMVGWEVLRPGTSAASIVRIEENTEVETVFDTFNFKSANRPRTYRHHIEARVRKKPLR